jgi:hypothetical protein
LFLKSLSQVTNTIFKHAKETDENKYKDASNKLTPFCKELDAKMIELFKKYE